MKPLAIIAKTNPSKRAFNSAKTLKKQGGVALISVLFVVALGVIIAVEMSGRLQLQIQKAGNLSGNRQAYWYAVGAESLVKQQLKRINGKDSRSNVIHMGQDWAKTGMVFPVDGGNISGEIKDLQSCFNLNSLASDDSAGSTSLTPGTKPGTKPSSTTTTSTPPRRNGMTYASESFQRLLEAIEIDEVSEQPAEYLAQRLKDWLDADGLQTGGGGMEEGDYMSLAIPYLAANTLMTSISELRLIGGFNPAVIAKIKPYVCVIPGNAELKININTLDGDKAKLLTAMLKGLSLDDAKTLISDSAPEGYPSVNEFWQKSEMNRVNSTAKTEAKKYFDVTTQYFELKAQTSYGDSKFYLNSTLHINESKQVNVIARKFGVDL
ncbi:MAG: general secretion pathway protein K [Alteromonadaceae bacterium]|jgi:general secretion pathway protein K